MGEALLYIETNNLPIALLLQVASRAGCPLAYAGSLQYFSHRVSVEAKANPDLLKRKALPNVYANDLLVPLRPLFGATARHLHSHPH